MEQRDARPPGFRATADLGIDSTASGGPSMGYVGFSAAFVMITALSAALLRGRAG